MKSHHNKIQYVQRPTVGCLENLNFKIRYSFVNELPVASPCTLLRRLGGKQTFSKTIIFIEGRYIVVKSANNNEQNLVKA